MGINHVTVIGGGFMGAGIAQLTASYEYNVVVLDVSEKAVQNTRQVIEANLATAARRKFKHNVDAQNAFVQRTIAHLSYSWKLAEAVRNADLVIEAITENLNAKQKLFLEVERYAPSHAILVTNTSSLLIADISQPLKRKTHFAGLHFFSPVPLSRLVEIIRGVETADATFEAVKQFASSVEKEFILCKDTIGFVVNNLLSPFLAAAFKMAEDGVAEPSDIDKAVQLALGHPTGPLRLADHIGLDVANSITSNYRLRDPLNPIYRAGILERKVAEGKLGVKSGEGFYDYSGGKKSKL